MQRIGKRKVSFVVEKDGVFSHGKTVKDAINDLVYKTKADFEGDIPIKATGSEWVRIYRSVTGACSYGVKMFVETQNKPLDATYYASEICNITKGHYGHEKFSGLVNTKESE